MNDTAPGIDAIELSGGTRYSGSYAPVRLGRLDTENTEVYYLKAAGKFKERVKVPTRQSVHSSISAPLGALNRIVPSFSFQIRVPDIHRQRALNCLNVTLVQRWLLILEKCWQSIRMKHPYLTTFRLRLHKPPRIKNNRKNK